MSDDNKTPTDGQPTDSMAHARAAKAAKKAATPPEPPMELVRKRTVRTERYTTPTGRDVERTTEEVFRPVRTPSSADATDTAGPSVATATTGKAPSADTSEPAPLSATDRDAIREAGRARDADKGPLRKWLPVIVIAALALVLGAIYFGGGSSQQAETPVETAEPAPTPSPTPGPTPELTEVAPPPAPTPEVTVTPTPTPEPTRTVVATPPVGVPEHNMLSYVVRPHGDRRDDFIQYDFDRRRVCWTNSSGSADMPQTGCQSYDVLAAATKTTYDSLCRRHYAFPEVCPADMTADVVWRELGYHHPANPRGGDGS